MVKPVLEVKAKAPLSSASGMLLRDYMATAALEGLLAAVIASSAEYSPGRAKQFADSAYMLADALLKAREKKKP